MFLSSLDLSLQVLTLLLAGYDTSANSLALTIYSLARTCNANIQVRLSSAAQCPLQAVKMLLSHGLLDLGQSWNWKWRLRSVSLNRRQHHDLKADNIALSCWWNNCNEMKALDWLGISTLGSHCQTLCLSLRHGARLHLAQRQSGVSPSTCLIYCIFTVCTSSLYNSNFSNSNCYSVQIWQMLDASVSASLQWPPLQLLNLTY